MTTRVAEARMALGEARAKRESAEQAASAARATLDGLVASIAAGASDVTPAQLAEARAAVEMAELVAPGAESRYHECSAALAAAEADTTLDGIVEGLRARAAAVAATHGPLLAALDAFAEATVGYDAFVAQALRDTPTGENPRIRRQSNDFPVIDGTKLRRCRPPAQLCRLIAPTLRKLGAPQTFTEQVQMYAAGAPNLGGEQ